MDKVIQSSKNITPFGSLNFVFDAIKRASIDSFIDQQLGFRSYERCVNELNNNGISISDFRADSASYQKQVIDLVEKQADFFYICNINSLKFERECGKIQDWHTIEINYEKKEVSSLIYAPFDSKKHIELR